MIIDYGTIMIAKNLNNWIGMYFDDTNIKYSSVLTVVMCSILFSGVKNFQIA